MRKVRVDGWIGVIVGVLSLVVVPCVHAQSVAALSSDETQILIQKDVNDERWSITFRLSDGYVLGNVFSATEPAFLACNLDRQSRAELQHTCSSFDGTSWQELAQVTLPASFWFQDAFGQDSPEIPGKFRGDKEDDYGSIVCDGGATDVPAHRVCDGVEQCEDRSDERSCLYNGTVANHPIENIDFDAQAALDSILAGEPNEVAEYMIEVAQRSVSEEDLEAFAQIDWEAAASSPMIVLEHPALQGLISALLVGHAGFPSSARSAFLGQSLAVPGDAGQSRARPLQQQGADDCWDRDGRDIDVQNLVEGAVRVFAGLGLWAAPLYFNPGSLAAVGVVVGALAFVQGAEQATTYGMGAVLQKLRNHQECEDPPDCNLTLADPPQGQYCAEDGEFRNCFDVEERCVGMRWEDLWEDEPLCLGRSVLLECDYSDQIEAMACGGYPKVRTNCATFTEGRLLYCGSYLVHVGGSIRRRPGCVECLEARHCDCDDYSRSEDYRPFCRNFSCGCERISD